MDMRFEEGAFARSLEEINRAAIAHTNDYRPDHPFGAFLAHVFTDVLQSTVLESPVVKSLIESAIDSEPEKRQTLATLARTQATLHQVRTCLDQPLLDGLFTSLNELIDLFSSLNELIPAALFPEQDADTFLIPYDPALFGQTRQSSMTSLAIFGLLYSDQLWPRDSWPWTLTREYLFNLAGYGRYTGSELQKLAQSSQAGPVADLAAAHLAGRGNARAARMFAQKGQAALTSAAFQKDYRTLLQSDTPASQFLVKGLELLRKLGDDQITSLTNAAGVGPADGAFLCEAAKSIREAGGKPTPEALWPVVERHWDSSLKGHLQNLLDRFAPRIESTTNANELYKIGLSLMCGEGPIQDAQEAAQAFLKAAELGHAGAQMCFGRCCEQGQGVAQDFSTAAHWYRKADEQNEPHAACSLGNLYLSGRGVTQDLDEAVRCFRRDADRDCPVAMLMLGQIYEKQKDTVQALKWYRRAAEEIGHPEAQFILGDRLSDGITLDKPDYAEAYMWFSLAAIQGHPIAQSDARRVKRQLTAEQIEEAKRRGEAILERIREKRQTAEKRGGDQ
jgi:TPR repeat protein